ncbi:MAG TPA: DMT family transporter [Alphaproteobacteria bacterium]|nr:DMT family transporter [Alphaproteobacteria bacterium]MDP6271178.1 DMT family transporter [Alphaproteobacteria bacterium]MDP7428133.1 DMT family transporter [Alphaproteobacteria bacterium]HJM51486.1 DMT family transporter [Alphaproteobacteria bacterium]
MNRSTLLLLIGLTFFWGINWPIMKVGLSEFSVWTFRALASVTGAIGLFAIARAGGASLRVPVGERLGLVVAALLNITLWNVLILFGLGLMASGRAAILAFTMPLWATVIGSFVLGERLGRRQVLGLGLGLSGMALLLAGDIRALGAAPLGALLVVGAAISWAGGTVAVKYYRFTMTPTVLVAWQQVIGVIPIVTMALMQDTMIGPVTLWPALAVLYNMLVASIFCYWVWFRVVLSVPVATSTISTLMIPVLGVISGALALGERPGALDFAALVLVAGAIAVVLLPNRPSRR